MRIAVVGGGIVGLATATQLARTIPKAHIVLLEKESFVGLHQSGRNSGVLHSGIYYKPGSAKARTCRLGREMLLTYCHEHQIAHEVCGKVVVATRQGELSRLDALAERAHANDVAATRLDSAELKRKEPHARGLGALWVKEAGIIDFKAVMNQLARDLPGELRTDAQLLSLHRHNDVVVCQTTAGELETDWLINCGGLFSDRICRLQGQKPEIQIVPFKGEYFRLKTEAESLCRSLIYPVPDPAFPFLGVHLTRMVSGGVEAGPNAVLALGRQAYRAGDLNLPDLLETLAFPGFWRLASRHWRAGLGEVGRSLSQRAFVKALQRLVPDLQPEHLLAAPCGIRAQALQADGRLQDDFLIQREGRCWHVLNAPSPAATASFAIAKEIAEALAQVV